MQTTNTKTDQPNYLFVKAENGMYGMHKSFKPLGAVRDEEGWWFELDKEESVSALCNQAGMFYEIKELPVGGSLDAYKAMTRSTYFTSNLIDIEREILKKLNLQEHELTPENLIEVSKTPEGEKLVSKYRKFTKGLEFYINQETVARITPAQKTTLDNNNINIQFINKIPINYLSSLPPIAPTLLSIRKEQNMEPFLRKGIVAQLVGAGGIGKTHLLTQLAISIACGIPFLERYFVSKAGAVFMGLGENTDDDIHRLLHKIFIGLCSDADNALIDKTSSNLAVMSFTGKQASFVDRAGKPTNSYESLLKELKEKEPEDGWSLIILDPISRFLGPDSENDNIAATFFISLLEKITLELRGKPTLLFGHHMSKQGLNNPETNQTAARGASAITDGVRWQTNLEFVITDGERLKNKLKFKVVKSNFTSIPNPHILKRRKDGLLVSDEEQNNNKKYEQHSKKPQNLF